MMPWNNGTRKAAGGSGIVNADRTGPLGTTHASKTFLLFIGIAGVGFYFLGVGGGRVGGGRGGV